MKILAISDTHIGYEYANTDKIHKFLDSVDETTDALILNGDILDLWRMRFTQIRSGNSEILDRLNHIAVDIPTIWILGNHDYTTPQKEFPDISFKHAVDVDGTHFEHGHRFDIDQVKYSWSYKLIPKLYPPLHQLFFKSPAKDAPKGDQGGYLLSMHRRAIVYGLSHAVSVVIGHSHMPQIHQIGDTGYMCDCGDFVDSCTYIEITDGVPLLGRV